MPNNSNLRIHNPITYMANSIPCATLIAKGRTAAETIRGASKGSSENKWQSNGIILGPMWFKPCNGKYSRWLLGQNRKQEEAPELTLTQVLSSPSKNGIQQELGGKFKWQLLGQRHDFTDTHLALSHYGRKGEGGKAILHRIRRDDTKKKFRCPGEFSH